MSKPVLISILLLFLCLEWSSSYCPYQCQCFSPVQVLCAERLSSLPRNISHEARELILMTSSVSYLFSNTLEDSPQLTKLIFLNNGIRSIHMHSFNHLTQLEELEISGNPWLEHLYLGTFSNQHNLTKLILNYNRFKTVLPGMFASLRKLETLEMKGNIISRLPLLLFSNLNHLRVLDLSLNKLEDVTQETFLGLGQLEILKLKHNLLKNLSSDLFNAIPELKEFHLEGNKISELSENVFMNLTNLKVLNLRGNFLKTFTGHIFGISTLNLQELKLKGNNLSDFFPLGNFTSLTNLDLSSNHLSTLHKDVFQNMTNLDILDLSDNQIFILPETIFNDLFSLRVLNLQANNLSVIEPKLFEDQALIEQLNLSFNRLKTLPEGLMDTFSVHYMLRLHGNPWKCDCGLWYLHDWVLRNEQSVEMIDRTLCDSPAFLNRRSLDSVEKEQLVCHMGKENAVDVRNCLLQVSGDAVIIKCKVETCLPITVKVELQDEQGNVKEHVVRNEWTHSAKCSNMSLE
ncbi:hypothetical protein NL108_009587 [Boleophthalmus pectinirostris]|uniref:carboxypeptidase N subunit 2 n=1 Tax=Boleophthalmus pectinirostris TaxID=150288 RepID=UPI00242B0AF6|nr:carboxypeptidase N subunit 2 [Boleophthalmus pectinirostris]KAJ0059218.1 hypothetical protein NL108_009587 [Boleophthalmus pectinirostris]